VLGGNYQYSPASAKPVGQEGYRLNCLIRPIKMM